MKYIGMARGALALALGMMMSTALAANIAEESFEGYADDYAITNAQYWSGGPDDLSKVVPTGITFTATSYPMPATNHSMVLQLNTEGGTLTNALSAPESFDTQNLYVDTMVQFVPSEDLPDLSADDGIKIAAYAYITEVSESVATTNLAVYHGIYDSFGVFSVTNTVVTDLPVIVGDWYRLTIELEHNNDVGAQASKISVNGIPVTNANAYSADWAANLLDEEQMAPDGGDWFLSAAASDVTSVSTVQFKGTGYIDDLVVTKVAPVFGEPSPQAEPYRVTQAVTNPEGGTLSDATSPIWVPENATTTLVYTAKDFYEISALTVNGATVAPDSAKSHALLVTASNDIEITFGLISDYTADNVDWFVAKGWGQDDIVANGNGLGFDTLEMLGLAATNATANAVVTITNIEIVDGDVNVTVAIDRTMAVDPIAGNIRLYGWETLGGASALIGTADVAGNSAGVNYTGEDAEITFSFDGGNNKFFKAVVEYPAPGE
ncbi:MAG: hypothetical protein GX590_05040 [Lentisphaerae bacterium]|nr:hypothetical protein [Lentisphaerota bacterium]